MCRRRPPLINYGGPYFAKAVFEVGFNVAQRELAERPSSDRLRREGTGAAAAAADAAIAVAMPWSLANSNWLRLLALVHVVGKAGAFSPFRAGTSTGEINRGNSNCSSRRLHSGSIGISSGGVLLKRCCRGRPALTRGGGGNGVGLHMQQSYRNDAEVRGRITTAELNNQKYYCCYLAIRYVDNSSYI